MRRIGLTPWTPKMIERTLCLTGGALEATIHAVKYGGITGNMAGGTHPRTEILVRILHLQRSRNLCDVCNREIGSKSNALDLDVHQGDGTATILSNEARARTISVHCSTNFPFRKSESDFDLPVEPKAGDKLYMEKVREAVELCLDFQPISYCTKRGLMDWNRII